MSNGNVAIEYVDATDSGSNSDSRSDTPSPKPKSRRHKKSHESPRKPRETKTESCHDPEMNEGVAKDVEAVWKKAFRDATLIPASQGVMMLMHSLPISPLVINGLKSVSPLVNQATFSSECSGQEGNKRSLNFYVVRMPDLPGKNGRKSTVHVYLDSLAKESLNVSSVSTPWHGTSKQIKEIHHQNCGLSAKEFSERTIRALQAALTAIAHRMKH
jgi:hypothetical protein